MSLERLISKCGGIRNISRVLTPDNRLIAEVHNPELICEEAKQSCFNENLSQVTYDKPDQLTEEALLDMDSRIEAVQRERFADFQMPSACEYRPKWHVSPPKGLLNDPNGFIYHQGSYHLFYQWYPYGCEHKDKHWAHLTSKDLTNWEWQPVALTPSAWCDSHGVFSGHAVSNGEELMLFYTGNVRIDEQRDRHTTQCLATSTDGINFKKHGPVVYDLPPNVTPHCRDPKIVKHNDEWLMLLGVQTEELKGRLAAYKSSDLYNWEFDALYGDEFGDFGYMWECPDLFELGEQLFVVVGPQGIESESVHHTIEHHNGIAKAELGANGEIKLSEFEHLDYGFDFYAPQTALTADGKRVICGWMGLPDEVDHPSADNGWIHQLTGMREMSFENGKLYQNPVKEIETLRCDYQEVVLEDSGIDIQTNSYELELELEWGSELRLFRNQEHELKISLDKDSERLLLDRTNTLIREGDKVREVSLDSDKVQLRILADTSSVEVYINGGEKVMTSRVFVPQDATEINLSGKAEVRLWKLKSSSAPFQKTV